MSEGNNVIGRDTPGKFHEFIKALDRFLLNDNFRLQGESDITDDGFQKWLVEGYHGEYRVFSVSDNGKIIEVGIYEVAIYPKAGEKRKSHSYLIVAVKNSGNLHSSLQLMLDKEYIENKVNNIYTIYHSGVMGGKLNKCTGELLYYVEKKAPELIIDYRSNQKEVFLGQLDISQGLTWEQKETKQFVKNIIHYALWREEFRELHCS